MSSSTSPQTPPAERAQRTPKLMSLSSSPKRSFRWRAYAAPKISKYSPGGAVFALVSVGALLLLVPLVQSITGGPPEPVTIREFANVLPPPPPPPPDPPAPVDEVVEEPPPQMKPPPMNLSLSQLAMAINPGVGGALAAGDFGLGEVNQVSSTDTLAEIQLFEISQLDERPRPLTNEQFDAPPRIKQARTPIKAIIEFVINPDGTVTFTKFHEVSPAGVEDAMIAYVNRMRFSKPMKDGKPVAARYGIPINIVW